MSLIGIIVAIVVIWLALTYLPIPAPLRTVIGIIAGLAIIVWLLSAVGLH